MITFYFIIGETEAWGVKKFAFSSEGRFPEQPHPSDPVGDFLLLTISSLSHLATPSE